MNKAFEKILGRLEKYENNDLIEHDSEQSEHCKRIDCGIGMDCPICVMEKAKEIVQEVAEEYNGGWIACSDRLPEENQQVILQDFYGNITIEKMKTNDCLEGFSDGDWWSSANNYVAWQPLPKPFKERD